MKNYTPWKLLSLVLLFLFGCAQSSGTIGGLPPQEHSLDLFCESIQNNTNELLSWPTPDKFIDGSDQKDKLNSWKEKMLITNKIDNTFFNEHIRIRGIDEFTGGVNFYYIADWAYKWVYSDSIENPSTWLVYTNGFPNELAACEEIIEVVKKVNPNLRPRLIDKQEDILVLVADSTATDCTGKAFGLSQEINVDLQTGQVVKESKDNPCPIE